MERAEVMTALRSGGQVEFPTPFEQRVPENAKEVRWSGIPALTFKYRRTVVSAMWKFTRGTRSETFK